MAFKLTEHRKWLVCSDIHFPKEDKRAVELLLKVAKWFKPDAIDLAGDIDDAECTGRWVEGTPFEMVSIKSGAEPTKEFLSELARICPNAEDKHFHGGNHDFYRHEKYLLKHSPNTLEYVTPDILYGLNNSGFEWHDYDRPPVERLGGIFVHHGESISKHSAESVRNDVQNYMVPLIRGHSHRAGVFYQTFPLAGIEIEGYEIGHLTSPNLHTYQTQHNWQQAFLTGHVVDGVAHLSLHRIKEYSCVVDGKIFQA